MKVDKMENSNGVMTYGSFNCGYVVETPTKEAMEIIKQTKNKTNKMKNLQELKTVNNRGQMRKSLITERTNKEAKNKGEIK